MAGLASLAERARTSTNGSTSDCLIVQMDSVGAPKPDTVKRFQYFPETVSDTKAINYQKKEVPGGSLPIYQWVNSGERIISFTAVFTTDTALIEGNGDKRTDLVERQDSTGVGSRNVDVRSALAWLRFYTLPEYIEGGAETGVTLVKAPPKLWLCMPNSGIGTAGGLLIENDIPAIMTQCDITYEAFFPSGLPRIATVQMAFAQIAQVGGYVSFPRREESLIDDLAVTGNDAKVGYHLGDKSKEQGSLI